MLKENYLVKRKIVPKRVFYRGRETEIEEIDDHLIIEKYRVVLIDDKIMKILLVDCRHPNADPYTGEYCLPYTLKGLKFTKENLKKIDKSLELYNLLNCYEIPYGHFKVVGGRL